MSKIKIGITIGDINGVGAEVIIKTFSDRRICDLCTPFLYGSSKVITHHRNIVNIDLQYNNIQDVNNYSHNSVNIINCWKENIKFNLGKATEIGGKYAFASLEAATKDLKEGLIDAVVTAPINKEAMKLANFPFPGHTEYLTQKFSEQDSLMLMVNDDLRVGVVTGHMPLAKVAGSINKKLLMHKLEIMHESLRMDFGIDRPTIAVLGLNPHASDNGVMGTEEAKIIKPAIIELKKNGVLAMGPYAADGFFGSGLYRKFDGIMAMYHDQGLIPFKALSFNAGVNYTAGLSIVRTSPDHGTAYDIVGKNLANPASFRKALFTALDIAKNRKNHFDMNNNRLERRSDQLEQVEENAADLVEE